MGKRKSRAKPAAKKLAHGQAGQCILLPLLQPCMGWEQCRMQDISLKNNVGEASCRICQESFSTTVNALTEPIDIYSEWIDACEEVNNQEEDADAA